MNKTDIRELLCSESELDEVVIGGWIRTRRDAKDFSFLEVNDGSCLANIQVIADATMDGYSLVKEITTGSSVIVRGRLTPSPGKGQKWEIQASSVIILNAADAETFPLQKKRHSDEFLRNIAHLRPRTNKYGAMFRIRSEASFAVHNFFRDRGFFHVHTPIITGSDCEGAGEMFRLTTLAQGETGPENAPFEYDFFGREANLTVSGQLEAEPLACALGRVYTFGPTFRAENSNTPRHAAEFWMIEPEMAFFDLEDTMDLAEEFIKELIGHLRTHCAQDLDLFMRFVDKDLKRTLDSIQEQDFLRLPYGEAIDILKGSGRTWDFEPEHGIDLQTEHERYLTEQRFKKPVIVYDYPKSIKPFYMRVGQDESTVRAMDLLVPRIGELIGGSQREERLEFLDRRMAECGLDPEPYWWYRELRSYGSVPHSGFGMGFERFLMLVTGVTNIRDVIPFPRTPRSLEF